MIKIARLGPSLLWGGAALVLQSCVGGTPLPRLGGGDVVETDDFTFEAPPGEPWDLERGTRQVTLSREKRRFFQVIGGTTLRVFRGAVPREIWDLPPALVAGDFLDGQERFLRGTAGRQSKVEQVLRGTEVREGRRLYWMASRTVSSPDEIDPLRRTESFLYLYFPQDSERTHVFYGILLSEWNDAGSGSEPATPRLMDPVLRSLSPRVAPGSSHGARSRPAGPGPGRSSEPYILG